MGRIKQRNTGQITIIIILFIVSIITTYFGYNYYLKYNNTLKEINKLTENITNDAKENDSKLLKLEEVNKKLNILLNIDESIEEMKNEVFKNASLLENKINNNETEARIAYLTFDDGPYYSTYKYLDVLHEKNVKATFFLTDINGQYCYDNKSYDCHTRYQDYLKDGHTIGNHTYTHSIQKGLYKSINAFTSAIEKQENLIKEKTGITTNIMRFPGGSGAAKTRGLYDKAISYLKEKEYGWVDWTAQTGDGGTGLTKELAWENFKNSTGDDKIEVVLMHDYSRFTIQILPEAIDYLREKGYILLPLFYESSMVQK